MKRARRLSGISGMVMKSLFARKATLMYPQRERHYPAATRGLVQNDILRCIFCGQCGRKCPTAAIEVRKAVKEWQIDSMRCCSCRRCVEVCPVSCLAMVTTYWPPVTSREDGLYVLTFSEAEAHAYDGEERPLAAAAPGSSEGSRTEGKRGF